MRYIYTLTYEDLFYLTEDKKYYIFNVIIENNNFNGESEHEERWVLGLPFWKKYQFSFDTDNKLIYFYDKEGKFIDKSTQKSREIQDINEEVANINNDTNITNNQRIISEDKNKKINYDIKIDKLIYTIILSIFFVVLFFFFIYLIRKTLFKKGYSFIRNKKANELEDEYIYMSKNNDLDKTKKHSNKKELEMQIKSDN